MALSVTVDDLIKLHGSEKLIIRIVTLEQLRRVRGRLRAANLARMRERHRPLSLKHSSQNPSLWSITVRDSKKQPSR